MPWKNNMKLYRKRDIRGLHMPHQMLSLSCLLLLFLLPFRSRLDSSLLFSFLLTTFFPGSPFLFLSFQFVIRSIQSPLDIIFSYYKSRPILVSLACVVEMEGVVVRRLIPSDNSCLFNAAGYVMEHTTNKASELRQVIAATVASDPEKYNDAFLEKSNEAYCAWIMDPEKWGGAIELSILSEHYGREIAAYDIQTTRCDLYGQEKKYTERAMLIYDGLHYDALAVSPFEGAPEEFDQTIFPIDHNDSIGPAEGLALNLVRDSQRKRSYTDTSNFTLQCGVCHIGVIGQKEAVEHAQATGHVNFQEYR